MVSALMLCAWVLQDLRYLQNSLLCWNLAALSIKFTKTFPKVSILNRPWELYVCKKNVFLRNHEYFIEVEYEYRLIILPFFRIFICKRFTVEPGKWKVTKKSIIQGYGFPTYLTKQKKENKENFLLQQENHKPELWKLFPRFYDPSSTVLATFCSNQI